MIQREKYLKKIRRLSNKDIVKVITGTRRSGKSTLMEMFKKELLDNNISPENIIYINFEEKKYRDINNNTQLDTLIYSITENIEDKIYLFFDEIQNVAGWEKSINSYRIDLNSDIYITGSNSKLLSGELATYLTGRYMEIKVYPLSYNEILKYKKQSLSKEILENKTLLESYEEEILNEYIKYGGMPFIQKLDDEDKYTYLNDLFDSIIFKDLIIRYKIREVDLFRRLINYLMDNVGNITTPHNISKYLKNEKINISSNSIRNYIKYLENVCLVNITAREDIKGKEILKYKDKIYFTDHGFIQAFNNPENKNTGHLIENIVYNELLRNDYQVTIGKIGKNEIDFIAKKNDEKIYIQVTKQLSAKETITREFGNLEKIKDNYPKYVISLDKHATSQNGIKHLYLKDFLKGNFN